MLLIVKGKDVHTVRLEQSLRSLGKQYKTVKHPNEIDNITYGIAFVDPSFEYDISTILKADKIAFYDCEDSSTHFCPGTAWHTLKAKTYVKMNYNEKDSLNIHKVAFPLPTYCDLAKLARTVLTILDAGIRSSPFIPTFVGSPTYLGNYTTPEKVIHKNTKELKVLSDINMYNQRYDWLNALDNYQGGIVFQENSNLSLKYQTEHFGDVKKFQIPPMPYMSLIHKLFDNRIGLCPTGHERLSWRTWDIMSVGAILFITDFESQRCLYMPKEYILVKDDDNIKTLINSLSEKDLNELYKASRKNVELMAYLTPEIIWNDFYTSIE